MGKRKKRALERVRKPFQGVFNIVRFNWHFYVLAVLVAVVLIVLNMFYQGKYTPYVFLLLALGGAVTVMSLLVSFYVYDLSPLYALSWLKEEQIIDDDVLVNIHAGFDETSVLLNARYPQADLRVFDFYDPAKHTEISIERARKAYPPYPCTLKVETDQILLPTGAADAVFVLLTAHEIRNDAERVVFFTEVRRLLKTDGVVVVVEHLRDLPNFIAYNIGFFHFLSKKTWIKTFDNAKLHVEKQFNITPFLSVFILNKHGFTP